MALLLVVGLVSWLLLCVMAVGLCVAAKRGDAEQARAPVAGLL